MTYVEIRATGRAGSPGTVTGTAPCGRRSTIAEGYVDDPQW
jgi:hypothetical protein